MARPSNILTTRSVEVAKRSGLHADGAGLYLRVTSSGSKNWVFRYRRDGKLVDMGLGPIGAVGLKDARMRAAELRRQRHSGVDPRLARREAKAEAKRDAALPTFGDVADRLIEDLRPGWRNAKHATQWTYTLSARVVGSLRDKRVNEVATADILAVLKPLWQSKPETAQRLRGRLEKVLDAAKAKGFRTGDNPAAWRGHLDHMLSKRKSLSRGHHAAMPFADVPSFVGHLKGQTGVAARALEFAILTAGRSGEVRGATWGEVDIKEKLWVIPAERMKSERPHRVPLGERAFALLDAVAAGGAPSSNALLFPGARRNTPLSDMSLSAVLKRMGVTGATVHGFRSSFRDWAGDRSTAAREVAEAALAHVVGDKVEAAYRRGDALEKRRQLMAAWAAYVGEEGTATVLPFPAKA